MLRNLRCVRKTLLNLVDIVSRAKRELDERKARRNAGLSQG
jgi:hypothetical protein